MKETKDRGITLIALIITVIIMLILAGVAINLTIGDNGIFKKTQEARNIYEEKVTQEESDLNALDVEFDEIRRGEKPTVQFIITPETEAAEKVQIQVIATKRDGAIVSLESLNGLTLLVENSISDKVYEVTKNGKYKFEVIEDNGRVTIVEQQISNIIYSSILSEIPDIEESGEQEIRVIGKIGEEKEEVNYLINAIVYKGNLILDGETEVEGATLNEKVYAFGSENDVAKSTTELAKNTVVLKVEGDLTIKEGVTVEAVKSAEGFGGPKGMIIYCTGTLTNNGRISMSQNGAYANGENVYLWENQDKTGSSGAFEYVPKLGRGGSGPGGLPGGNYTFVYPIANTHGTGRQTAGGASGGAARIGAGQTSGIRGGNGGQGTSYSGGGGRRRNSNKRCSYRN